MESDDLDTLGVQQRGFSAAPPTPENLAMRDIVASCFEKWPRPIPVSERLPETDEVLVWTDGSGWEFFREFGRSFNAEGQWIDRNEQPITHWLPLPPAPSGETP